MVTHWAEQHSRGEEEATGMKEFDPLYPEKVLDQDAQSAAEPGKAVGMEEGPTALQESEASLCKHGAR